MTRPISYDFDEATVDLVLEGLNELPYKRVHRLIGHIVGHARATLAKPVEMPTPPVAPIKKRTRTKLASKPPAEPEAT